MRTRATLIVCCLLLTACLSARPWYEKELKAWVGAPVSELENAWGPPTRTVISKSGLPEMVYKSVTYRDDQEDVKRDPNLLLSDRPPSPRPQIDELECEMRFQLENDIVVAVSHDGAGCQVIPRPGKSPRS